MNSSISLFLLFGFGWQAAHPGVGPLSPDRPASGAPQRWTGRRFSPISFWVSSHCEQFCWESPPRRRGQSPWGTARTGSGGKGRCPSVGSRTRWAASHLLWAECQCRRDPSRSLPTTAGPSPSQLTVVGVVLWRGARPTVSWLPCQKRFYLVRGGFLFNVKRFLPLPTGHGRICVRCPALGMGARPRRPGRLPAKNTVFHELCRPSLSGFSIKSDSFP